MRLEHFEAHLNELLHDLSSPLNSMRLQLGLLRDALKSDERLVRRVEATERQVLRAQQMMDTFVSSCSASKGETEVGSVTRRVFEKFQIDLIDETGSAKVGVSEKTLVKILTNVAEGCIRLMSEMRAGAAVAADLFVLRVYGEFDQQTVARALRLSFVDENGEPELVLAAARLGTAAANGTILLEKNALVLRLPLVIA